MTHSEEKNNRNTLRNDKMIELIDKANNITLLCSRRKRLNVLSRGREDRKKIDMEILEVKYTLDGIYSRLDTTEEKRHKCEGNHQKFSPFSIYFHSINLVKITFYILFLHLDRKFPPNFLNK